MSQLLINDYLSQLDLIKKVSGSQRETIVREAFKDFLKAWGRQHDLVFLAEDPLSRHDEPDTKARAAGLSPKPLLKSNPAAGSTALDTETTLRGLPPEAWAYKLGNRCAIDWVLDQHKEKKPKDPTIREKFDTYRFADHKEKVVDLLYRVTTVSVETVKITEAMKGLAR
jgi:hypothetical protein